MYKGYSSKGISPFKIDMQFFAEDLEGGGAVGEVVSLENVLTDTGESDTGLEGILQTTATGLEDAGGGNEPLDSGEPSAGALQDKDTNAHYANIRRRAEAEAENKAMEKLDLEIARTYSGYSMPLSGKPILNARDLEEAKREQEFAGSFANDLGFAGLPNEEIGKVYNKLRETILTSDPEVVRAKEQLREIQEQNDRRIFEENLKEIKGAYPDEKASSIEELGQEFIKMVGFGELSPLEAYKILRERKGTAKAPPSMGDIKSLPPNKDFFTKNEVDNMSEKQVNENFDKILKSMEKWK